jgi:hypothetical protein
MFENSHSSGMWPAEAPLAISFFSSPSPGPASLFFFFFFFFFFSGRGRCSDVAYLHPLLAPPFSVQSPFNRHIAVATSLAPQIVA